MSVLLPEPRKPFPIKHPYRVRSDMYKMGRSIAGYSEDTLFIIDSDYETVLRESLAILKNYPQYGRVYLDNDIEALSNCLWDIAACIAKDLPQFFTFEDNCFTSKLIGLSLKRGNKIQFMPENARFPEIAYACYEHLKPLNAFEQLCDFLRLSVEEDLVIGKVAPDNSSDVMECMLVTLPSKWNPLEKNGLDFAGIHAEIPGSEGLQAAAPRLIKAIMTKGDFVRYNWTISNASWSRNPAIEGDYSHNDLQLTQSISDFQSMMQKVYFRSERQTFRAFPRHNRYLFAIHTYLHPLSKILINTERQEAFLAVLQTVPRDISEHRGMVSIVIEQLSRELGNQQAGV